MKMILASALILVSTLGSVSLAQTQSGNTVRPKGFQLYGKKTPRFMPPNNLHMRRFREEASHVSKEQFEKITDDAIKMWAPFAALHGGQLVAEKLWDDETVNAQAEQEGKLWKVTMFGGLARAPEMTPDGFALVVCHELGHHFAGFSFVDATGWAANEGQSDYFATSVCAKALWAKDGGQNQSFRRLANVPAVVQQGCGQAYPNNVTAQGWCVRAAAASQALANLLASGTGVQPNFATPDQSVVKATNSAHPAAQCRLDTLFQGSLCTKNWDPKVIPGRRAPQGQMSAQAEMAAAQFSCTAKEGFKIGVRPSCWFKSVLN